MEDLIDLMDVKVHIAGLVRDIVRDADVQVSLPDSATVADLLPRLVDRYGEGFRQRLFRNERELGRSVKIFVGSEAVRSLDQQLKPSSRSAPEVTVMILSPIAGG